MGYHTRNFEKGIYGDFSKVQEEWEELLDARFQNARVLELCEIADLYGAIAGYVESNFGMTMGDIAQMAEMTRSAFVEGGRSTTPAKTDPCDVCLIDENDVEFVPGDDKTCWFSKT